MIMADKINDGGAAFPRPGTWNYIHNAPEDYPETGMALRDWFAAQTCRNPASAGARNA